MDIKYCNNEQETYPNELLQGREVIEGNVIAGIWKDTEILEEHVELKQESFITFDGRVLFTLADKMYKDGYRTLDEISVYTYLQDKSKLKEYFDNIGGYNMIKELTGLISKDNIDKYVDELNKWNILLGLHDRGFNVCNELEKFKLMKSNQIYDYFDLLLNDMFIKKSMDTEISDFKIGIENYLEEADKGVDMGYSFKQSSPLLNYITSGVMDGFHIVAGLSGAGKTTFVISTYILPLIENGYNIILLCNEQVKKEWWNMVLSTILSSKFNYFFNRKRFLQGSFTAEEKIMLNKAVQWLKEQPGQMQFVKMFTYNLTEVKMILKKYAKLGYNVTIYDTFKADTSDGDNRNPLWQTLLHSSKELFQTCSKEGMRMICTVQIAQRFANTRYLNNSCLSGATSIIEVASTCILLRHAWEDEKDAESKFFIKPYNYIKGEDGKYSKTKKYADINIEKRGIIAFVSKNRAGDSEIELYYEQDPHVNRWYECGFCTVSRTLY